MLWLDGHLREDGQVPFDLSDRGLLLGDGLFDTAMALGGRVAFEDAHVARLAAGAETLGFVIDRDRVVAGMRGLAAALPRAAIRTTVTRGGGPRGLSPPPSPLPTHWASASPLREGMAFSAISLMTVSIRRNDTSPAARVKSLGYLDAVLATATAKGAGYDEALFLNTRGHLACAATGNVFLVGDDRLTTPRLEDGVLPGIIRDVILRQVAPAIGIGAVETSLCEARLSSVEGLFLTNSLRLIAPVSRLHKWNIPIETAAVIVRLAAGLREAVAESCGVGVDVVT